MNHEQHQTEPHKNARFKKSWIFALVSFLALAGYFLWKEQPSAFPYLFLLVCIGMHFFMHSGHKNS